MAFEKWTLTKFLQLVFKDRALPFSLPRYGSEERFGFDYGYAMVGQLKAVYESPEPGTTIQMTNLPNYVFSDLELLEMRKTLTEEELERLHKDLTKR
jgi:hypothetical protein